jgi:hypothetical protein
MAKSTPNEFVEGIKLTSPLEVDGSLPITIKSPLESNGAVPVNIQDQHTRAFDLYFQQDVGSSTTLLSDGAIGDYSIECATGHGLAATDRLILRDAVSQSGYTGEVVSIVGDNTVNLDRSLDRVFLAASTVVQEVTNKMNVDGSGTRQIFTVGSPLIATLDITRLLFQMTTTGVPAFDEFGDLTALTRGVTMRVANGFPYNLWNVKSNAELANHMYDITVYESSLPFANNGLAGRMTYAGPEKHGVTIRLGPGEFLECIIQDDLSDLLSFKIIACGHIVTD